MSYFNNNFVGTNFNYYSSEDQSLDGYPFMGYDQPIPDPRSSQDWYLHTSSEGYGDQSEYQGYSVLGDTGCQFANPHALSADHAYNDSTTNTNVNNLTAHEQTINIPAECASPSLSDLAASPFRVSPTYPNNIPPVTVGTPLYSAPEQPLAELPLDSHRADIHPPASADKGKARARNHTPRSDAMRMGDYEWQHQQPHTTDACRTSTPQTIAPSHGPQRSEGAKGKGKATHKGKGRLNRGSAEPLPEGVDSSWEQAKDRFVCELLEVYYFRPAGRSINPETAFAFVDQFIKEDLHRSPLADQAVAAREDKRESRVHEQYLVHILKELRRSKQGEIQKEVDVYRQVLQELRNELAPVNERCILRDGHTPNRGPDELDSSTRKVKHRGVEQARRTAIRHLHEQMSVYFSVPKQRKISARDLLLFTVVYLRIGPLAFPGLVHPLPSETEQQD